MQKNRLEAFSDGVIAIIITIMVLELKVPHGEDWASIRPLLPTLLSYVLSFIFVGIYWNNHHHLLHVTHRIIGSTLWANSHLLFWLSLTPFVTAWMGENHFTAAPVAAYGIVLFMSAIAYYMLVRSLLSQHENSTLAQAIGKDKKGLISPVLYAIGIGFAYINSAISLALYVLVAIIWFLPDRRIEKHIQ